MGSSASRAASRNASTVASPAARTQHAQTSTTSMPALQNQNWTTNPSPSARPESTQSPSGRPSPLGAIPELGKSGNVNSNANCPPPTYHDAVRSSQHDMAQILSSASAAADLAGITTLSAEESESLLVMFSTQIFRKADPNHYGYLMFDDFCSLVQSPTLDLGISETEAERMLLWAAVQHGDRVLFREFMPVMRELLSKHSQRSHEMGSASWQVCCIAMCPQPSTTLFSVRSIPSGFRSANRLVV